MKSFIKEFNKPLSTTSGVTYTWERGWGCGYVVITKSNSLYGYDIFDYAEDIHIHGGLTFSRRITKDVLTLFNELDENDLDKWILGFDTAHHGDTLKNWPAIRVAQETDRLVNICINKERKIQDKWKILIKKSLEF